MFRVIFTDKRKRIAFYGWTNEYVALVNICCNYKTVIIVVVKEVTILTIWFKNEVFFFGFIFKCINHADMIWLIFY